MRDSLACLSPMIINSVFSGLRIYSKVCQFGYCFAFNIYTVWDAFTGDICAATSIVSFRMKLKSYL